jgi:hypothetical protein
MLSVNSTAATNQQRITNSISSTALQAQIIKPVAPTLSSFQIWNEKILGGNERSTTNHQSNNIYQNQTNS